MIATLERLRDIGNTRHRGRARRRHHSRGRLPRRDGARARRSRRPRRRAGHDRRSDQVQGVADRPVPLGQTLDPDAGAAADRQRHSAGRPRRAREQPEVDRRGGAARQARSPSPARPDRARARWSATSSTRRCGSGSSTRARCPANTTASTGWSTCTRWSASTNRRSAGTAAPTLPPTSASTTRIRDLFTHAPLSIERELQAGAIQLQRQGRPLRGVPGRRGDHHPAVLHAGRRGDLRRVQGRAVQQRDARSHGPRQDHRRRARHVDRGRRRASSPPNRRFTARSRCWTSSDSAT